MHSTNKVEHGMQRAWLRCRTTLQRCYFVQVYCFGAEEDISLNLANLFIHAAINLLNAGTNIYKYIQLISGCWKHVWEDCFCFQPPPFSRTLAGLFYPDECHDVDKLSQLGMRWGTARLQSAAAKLQFRNLGVYIWMHICTHVYLVFAGRNCEAATITTQLVMLQ